MSALAAPVRSHVRRRVIKGARALIAVVAIVAVGSTVYVITLPGVGDALSRVKRILVLHHGTYEPSAPQLLGDAVVYLTRAQADAAYRERLSLITPRR